jgi:putative addiction module CopG family antidote
MEITISEPMQDFVKQAVREGRYASESDVVDQSLGLLEENERKLSD